MFFFLQNLLIRWIVNVALLVQSNNIVLFCCCIIANFPVLNLVYRTVICNILQKILPINCIRQTIYVNRFILQKVVRMFWTKPGLSFKSHQFGIWTKFHNLFYTLIIEEFIKLIAQGNFTNLYLFNHMFCCTNMQPCIYTIELHFSIWFKSKTRLKVKAKRNPLWRTFIWK